jgi:hypothetical protein
MERLAWLDLLSYEFGVDTNGNPALTDCARVLPDSGDSTVDLDQTPCEAVDAPDMQLHQLNNHEEPDVAAPSCPSQLERFRALAFACLPMLAAMLALWNVLLVFGLVLGLPQNDFCRMYYTTRAYWQGEDMFGWNPATPARLDDDTAVDLWNMNPPHFHLILLPLGVLPRGMALECWWIMNFLCLFACVRWIAAEVQLEITTQVRQLGLVALLAFAGTNCMIVTSQLAFVLLVPLTLAWRGARHGRWAWCGFWLGVVMSIKPFLLLLVPYLLLRRRWQAVVACGSAGILCFALGVLVFGIDNHLSWQRGLGSADSWAWLPMNASLLGMLSRTFSENLYFTEVAILPPSTIRTAFFVLGATIALISLYVTTRDSSPIEVDRSQALLLTTSIMLCPLGWAYYFWLPLGPVTALVLDWKRRSVGESARKSHGRPIFWIAFVGLFWPIQLNSLGQYSAVATVLIANLYFWSILGIWLGLLLDGWASRRWRTIPLLSR